MSNQQLRVAFLGKGGVGKSVIAATVSRHLARCGWPVLALDVDTVPGLALSLGVPLGEGGLPSGLAELVEGKRGRRWKILKGAGPATLVDRYAVPAADGVRFLALGKLPGGVQPSITVAFRHVMEGFRRPGWAIVADLAAGTRQAMFGWAHFAPVRVAIVEPSAKSTLTTRRLAAVATHLVVNKVQGETDVEVVMQAVDLPLLAAIPYDEGVLEAEQRGCAPIDFDPHLPSVKAVAELANRLQEMA